MIVEESDALLAALDRRLRVDRVLALDGGTSDPDAARASRTTPSQAGAALDDAVAPLLEAFEAVEQDSLAARLPLGRVVIARVIDASDPEHPVVQIDRWRVTLTLPATIGMRPGDQLALRVLAHSPALLFQDVESEGGGVRDDAGAPDADVATRWSRDAVELARGAVADGAYAARVFTKPILDIAPTAGSETTEATTPADVVAERDTVVRDPSTLPNPNPNPNPMPTAIVLQGPAWPGQPMEIVVRRERADEAFDNAALDQWCGEIVIDLPRLGRVVGHLAWSMQGLRIRLEGGDDTAASSMDAATPELAAALIDAALPVVALTVGRPATAAPSRHD